MSGVCNGGKGDVAEDLRYIFRTGDRNYTVEQAWSEWQQFCVQWGRYYKSIRKRGEDASYKAYFTYLTYDHRIQSYDIYYELDRTAAEGFLVGYEDAWRNA